MLLVEVLLKEETMIPVKYCMTTILAEQKHCCFHSSATLHLCNVRAVQHLILLEYFGLLVYTPLQSQDIYEGIAIENLRDKTGLLKILRDEKIEQIRLRMRSR